MLPCPPKLQANPNTGKDAEGRVNPLMTKPDLGVFHHGYHPADTDVWWMYVVVTLCLENLNLTLSNVEQMSGLLVL